MNIKETTRNPVLTIFTPTYNRAYILNKCYESLKSQTLKEFIWLIIDDGSTDNTRELVDSWIKESKITIKYYYQENIGMHGAHNTAYRLITTELNTCIDSDDYMPNNAVESIVEFWEKNKSESLAGFVGLDAYKNGNIVGTLFPKDVKTSKYFDIYNKYKVKGDKKFIYRTELTRKFPYPIFEGEKYVSLAYKYMRLDQSYELGLLNKVLCIVEYMEDGSSLNMINQYKRNPKGFAFIRVENLKMKETSVLFKFRQCIHYVSSSLISKNKNFIKHNPYKLLTICAIPLGSILYMYIMKKSKKNC